MARALRAEAVAGPLDSVLFGHASITLPQSPSIIESYRVCSGNEDACFPPFPTCRRPRPAYPDMRTFQMGGEAFGP